MDFHKPKKKGMSGTAPLKINFVGDIFLDIIAREVEVLPQWGEDVLSRQGIQIYPGGSCLNTCIHGSTYLSYMKLRNHVSLRIFSAVGSDKQAEACLRVRDMKEFTSVFGFLI